MMLWITISTPALGKARYALTISIFLRSRLHCQASHRRCGAHRLRRPNRRRGAAGVRRGCIVQELSKFRVASAIVKRKAAGLMAAAKHLHQHGLVASYVCWSCRTKFKAVEKDPHICPGCGTDLDA
jgi:hypothetical protein